MMFGSPGAASMRSSEMLSPTDKQVGEYGQQLLSEATKDSLTFHQTVAQESKLLLTDPESVNVVVRSLEKSAQDAVQQKRSAYAAGKTKRKTESEHNSFRVWKRGGEGPEGLVNGDGMDANGEPIRFTREIPEDVWSSDREGLKVSEGSISKILDKIDVPGLWEDGTQYSSRRASDRDSEGMQMMQDTKLMSLEPSATRVAPASQGFFTGLETGPNQTIPVAERMGEIYSMANEGNHEGDLGTLHQVLSDQDRNMNIDMSAFDHPSFPSFSSMLSFSSDPSFVKKEADNQSSSMKVPHPKAMVNYAQQVTNKVTKGASTVTNQVTKKATHVTKGATNVTKGLQGAMKKVGSEVKTNISKGFKIEESHLGDKTARMSSDIASKFNKLRHWGKGKYRDETADVPHVLFQPPRTGPPFPMEKSESMDVLEGVLGSDPRSNSLHLPNNNSLSDFSGWLSTLNDDVTGFTDHMHLDHRREPHPDFPPSAEMPPPADLFTNEHASVNGHVPGSRALPPGGLAEAGGRAEEDQLQEAEKGRSQWSAEEDQLLQEAVRELGVKAWREVAKRVPGRSNVQCRARYKRCLAPGLVKGYWNDDEDEKLRRLVEQSQAEGEIDWRRMEGKIKGRSIKQCRERWTKNLDPRLKKGKWSAEEDRLILEQQKIHGNKWAKIARMLPGRTEHSVKTRHRSLTKQKHREWTTRDDALLLELYDRFSNQWQKIASHFPERTKSAVSARCKSLLLKKRTAAP